MATTYVNALDGVTGKRVVAQIAPDGVTVTIVAVCESTSRATQIATLLTADEA